MELIEDLGMQYSTETSKTKRRFGIYECPVCKKHYRVNTADVKSGHTTKCRSCSTKEAAKTHGLRKHRLYNTWSNQRRRCLSKENKNYKDYGGRCIKISTEFSDFVIWLTYVESLDNCYKDGYTLDRKNNDGNYERGNLRWVNKTIQARNTQKLNSNNTSGFRGVSKHKINNNWVATIVLNGKNKYLGSFDYPWTAAYVYDSYVTKHKLEHTLNFEELNRIATKGELK